MAKCFWRFNLMATTTPNFGWPVPTSTDLVKDGATAIEALGDSIDASLLDLKGGTTGQVLAKASGTDMDFSWVAQDDSNAIQNAIVDAKGDLIGATAADTPARLAVGTNGQVLTADSTAATGLAWATSPSGGMTLLSTTTLSTGTTTISTISASYTDLRVYIVNFIPSVDDGACLMRINSDTGSKYFTQSALGSGSVASATSISVIAGVDNVTTNGLSILNIPFYANTTGVKSINGTGAALNSNNTDLRTNFSSFGYNSTSAISSLTFFVSSGTMSGTVYVYGVK
jgi:hypothetical protein